MTNESRDDISMLELTVDLIIGATNSIRRYEELLFIWCVNICMSILHLDYAYPIDGDFLDISRPLW